MAVVHLNYNFEYDWLIELSDNKLSNSDLSNNNLASELVEIRSFLTNHNRRNCNFYDWKKKKKMSKYTVHILQLHDLLAT